MQAYTRFRSVFDVSPAGPMDNPWAALIGESRAWITRDGGIRPRPPGRRVTSWP